MLSCNHATHRKMQTCERQSTECEFSIFRSMEVADAAKTVENSFFSLLGLFTAFDHDRMEYTSTFRSKFLTNLDGSLSVGELTRIYHYFWSMMEIKLLVIVIGWLHKQMYKHYDGFTEITEGISSDTRKHTHKCEGHHCTEIFWNELC